MATDETDMIRAAYPAIPSLAGLLWHIPEEEWRQLRQLFFTVGEEASKAYLTEAVERVFRELTSMNPREAVVAFARQIMDETASEAGERSYTIFLRAKLGLY